MLGNLLQLSGGFGRGFEKMGKIISETVSFTQGKFCSPDFEKCDTIIRDNSSNIPLKMYLDVVFHSCV